MPATASYDSAIAGYFSERVWSAEGARKQGGALPASEVLSLEKITDLRYGENPHQRAALYRKTSEPSFGVAGAEFLHGKELSYNNLLDSDGAWSLVLEFDKPAATVIKHTNPFGVAQSDRLVDAYTTRTGLRSGVRLRFGHCVLTGLWTRIRRRK